ETNLVSSSLFADDEPCLPRCYVVRRIDVRGQPGRAERVANGQAPGIDRLAHLPADAPLADRVGAKVHGDGVTDREHARDEVAVEARPLHRHFGQYLDLLVGAP